MASRNPQVCREFIARAKEALSEHPNLTHSWSIDADENHCILGFPTSSPDGFPVVVEVYPEVITVSAHGYHQHFDITDDATVLVGHALGLARDLLSPSMRIRERHAGSTPYRWTCEAKRSGEWHPEGSTSLMFWNYFGPRSERCYQNHVLPERNEESNQTAQITSGLQSYEEAASVIEAFVDGRSGMWDWDDFTSPRKKDPFLESIRLRCLAVYNNYPAKNAHRYCSGEGLDVLRTLAREVRAEIATLQKQKTDADGKKTTHGVT